ncbi:hypothetical protein J2X63_001644 [Agromyces sp. 3263]|uniref:hypothetical protein n=1 Tax=Agromyces sp. 3263 TaxID=2817750 RepID=UPI002855583C|nr:hypothetical protein [Agromyces sp. 3263]MDR6905958.1 hypothetical protein [Agromyces sp. 3263]
MTLRAASGAGIVAAVLTVTVLSGCTAAPPAPSSSPSPATTASSAPTPEPESVPDAATCETVLTDEGYQKLAADGLESLPSPQVFDALAVRMVEAGGVACAWGKPNTDLVLTVVQVGVAPGEQEAWSQTLAESGYVLSDAPVAGAYSGPPDAANGISPVALPSSTTLTFVSSPAFAGMVASTD